MNMVAQNPLSSQSAVGADLRFLAAQGGEQSDTQQLFGFGAVIEQLLAQISTDVSLQPQTGETQLTAEIENLQGKDEPDTVVQDTVMAMQAEMLFAATTAVQTPDCNGTAVLQSETVSVFLDVDTSKIGQISDQVQQHSPEKIQKMTDALQRATEPYRQETDRFLQTASFTQKADMPVGEEQIFNSAGHKFLSAIQKMQIINSAVVQISEKQEPVDIEELQKGLNDRLSVNADGAMQAGIVETPQMVQQVGQTQEIREIKSISEQLFVGIEGARRSTKNECIVKLKPEGLGEITIKLIETAGKTTVALTAGTAATAKLLNSEIATLQDALRPYNVEPVQITVTQEGYTNTQQFDLNHGFEERNAAYHTLQNKQNSSVNDMQDPEISELQKERPQSILSERV